MDACRQTQEQAVANLLAERRKLRCAEPDDANEARLEQITQSLKSLRRDIRLCRQIAEQSLQMRERMNRRAENLPEQEDAKYGRNRENAPTR